MGKAQTTIVRQAARVLAMLGMWIDTETCELCGFVWPHEATVIGNDRGKQPAGECPWCHHKRSA